MLMNSASWHTSHTSLRQNSNLVPLCAKGHTRLQSAQQRVQVWNLRASLLRSQPISLCLRKVQELESWVFQSGDQARLKRRLLYKTMETIHTHASTSLQNKVRKSCDLLTLSEWDRRFNVEHITTGQQFDLLSFIAIRIRKSMFSSNALGVGQKQGGTAVPYGPFVRKNLLNF